MKRKSLYLASAVLSAALLAGVALPSVAEEKAATAKTEVTQPCAGPQCPKQGVMRRGPQLSPEGKKMFQEAMLKVRESNKALFADMMEKRKALAEMLTAKTFDKSAYVAKEMEIQTLKHKMAEFRAQAFADAAEKMSAADRAELAKHATAHKGPRPEAGPKAGAMGMKGSGMGAGAQGAQASAPVSGTAEPAAPPTEKAPHPEED